MALLSSPQQLLAYFPLTTRVFTGSTVALSILYYVLQWNSTAPNFAPYLTLIPGISIFYPWTLLTAGLVETTVIELAFTLLFVPMSLSYLERLWGAVETAKFIAVTTVIPNLMSFGVSWLAFVVFQNADLFLYGVEYHGNMALQTGILVAFTQLIPEHQVQVFGVVKVRVKRLPMAYVTLSTVMVLIGFQSPWIAIQWGWLVSWLYLRFYKKNRGDSIVGESYGDRSETFAFVSWFPPFLHQPITLLSNFVFSLCNRLHLLPGVTSSDIESAGYSPVPGGPRAEAERRRALALKALDQRIASTAGPAVGSRIMSNNAVEDAPSPTSSEGPAGPVPDAGKSRPLERRKSVGEIDITTSADEKV